MCSFLLNNSFSSSSRVNICDLSGWIHDTCRAVQGISGKYHVHVCIHTTRRNIEHIKDGIFSLSICEYCRPRSAWIFCILISLHWVMLVKIAPVNRIRATVSCIHYDLLWWYQTEVNGQYVPVQVECPVHIQSCPWEYKIHIWRYSPGNSICHPLQVWPHLHSLTKYPFGANPTHFLLPLTETIVESWNRCADLSFWCCWRWTCWGLWKRSCHWTKLLLQPQGFLLAIC